MDAATRGGVLEAGPSGSNPLLGPWGAPYGLPPFAAVHSEHFVPAFDVALREHRSELDAIGANPAPPTFENTIGALDRSGRLLGRIKALFENLTSSETSAHLQAVEVQMAPRLAAHDSTKYMHAALFARIDALHEQRDGLDLSAEQRRVLERFHTDFVRAGAWVPRRKSATPRSRSAWRR